MGAELCAAIGRLSHDNAEGMIFSVCSIVSSMAFLGGHPTNIVTAMSLAVRQGPVQI